MIFKFSLHGVGAMNPNTEGDEMFLLAAHMSRIVKVLQNNMMPLRYCPEVGASLGVLNQLFLKYPSCAIKYLGWFLWLIISRAEDYIQGRQNRINSSDIYKCKNKARPELN